MVLQSQVELEVAIAELKMRLIWFLTSCKINLLQQVDIGRGPKAVAVEHFFSFCWFYVFVVYFLHFMFSFWHEPKLFSFFVRWKLGQKPKRVFGLFDILLLSPSDPNFEQLHTLAQFQNSMFIIPCANDQKQKLYPCAGIISIHWVFIFYRIYVALLELRSLTLIIILLFEKNINYIYSVLKTLIIYAPKLSIIFFPTISLFKK